MESGRGERLLQQGRAGEAEKVFRALLARLEGDADYDTRYDQTVILAKYWSLPESAGTPLAGGGFLSPRDCVGGDVGANREMSKRQIGSLSY